MQAFLNIAAACFGLASGAICLYNWFDLINHIQLRRNELDRVAALKMIDKAEAHFEKHLNKPGGVGNYHMVSALYGVFFSQRLSALAYDRLHQATRRSHGLEDFSLQEYDGVLSKQRVAESYSHIASAIIWRQSNFEQRDLRPLSLKLLFAAFVTAIAATLV